MPADRMVDVPLIDKRSATIIADMGETLSLMDAGEPYETFEVSRPTDEKMAAKIQLNAEVEVWDVMGKRVITRVK